MPRYLLSSSPSLLYSDYCSLKKCAGHHVCLGDTANLGEANIPDRVHYACDVNEVAKATTYICRLS